MRTRVCLHLPIWYRGRLSPKCVIDRVRITGWIGHFSDGRETIDFGQRSEAEACVRYFERR